MPPWSSDKPTEQKTLRQIRWFLGLALLVALGFYGYLVWRFEPVTAAPIDAVSPLVARLTFEPALDGGTLDRISTHAEALHWADDHIAAQEETDRYVALQIYRRAATTNPALLTQKQWQQITHRLNDHSTALSLFAAELLLFADNEVGLPTLKKALDDSTPLTFIEPPQSRAVFAKRILAFYGFTTDETDNPTELSP